MQMQTVQFYLKTSLKNIGDLMILLVKIGQNFNV